MNVDLQQVLNSFLEDGCVVANKIYSLSKIGELGIDVFSQMFHSISKFKLYKYCPNTVDKDTNRNYSIENLINNTVYMQDFKKFEYLRGSKRILRTRPNGTQYYYSEGAMSPYDDLNLPGRTMLTSEGSTNRSTHIIMDPAMNQLRKLTPIECERLNQFPDDWTNTGMPENRRYFMMGNALVCGIVRRLRNALQQIIEE